MPLTITPNQTVIKIQGEALTIDEITRIGTAIRNNQLTRITLNNVHMDDEGAVILADAIKSSSRTPNFKLTQLELSDNKIKGLGIIALAEAVTVSNSIYYFDISNSWASPSFDGMVPHRNEMGRAEAEAIINMILNSKSLTQFMFSPENIDDETAEHMGNMFALNLTLTDALCFPLRMGNMAHVELKTKATNSALRNRVMIEGYLGSIKELLNKKNIPEARPLISKISKQTVKLRDEAIVVFEKIEHLPEYKSYLILKDIIGPDIVDVSESIKKLHSLNEFKYPIIAVVQEHFIQQLLEQLRSHSDDNDIRLYIIVAAGLFADTSLAHSYIGLVAQRLESDGINWKESVREIYHSLNIPLPALYAAIPPAVVSPTKNPYLV